MKANAAQPEYVGPEERWRLLGVAIVQQAVADWRDATRNLNNPKKSSMEMNKTRNSVEHFLRSPLVELYSDLDGRTILRMLKEEYGGIM